MDKVDGFQTKMNQMLKKNKIKCTIVKFPTGV